MKTIITFLIFTTSTFLLAQKIENIKVTYGFIDHLDFRQKRMDSISNTKKTMSKLEKEMSKNFDEAYAFCESMSSYELIATENESVFYSIKPMLAGDIHYKTKTIYKITGNFNLYQNKEKKERFDCKNAFGEDYLVDINSDDNIKIELTSETKIINDLECFKAKIIENNKNVIYAWYCPSIAINGSPEHCYNLPGLVLAIDYKMYSIVCKSIQFNIDEKELAKIKKPKGTYITKEKLTEMFIHYKEGLREKHKKKKRN
jgi:GLPGLI family protein